MGQIQRDKSWPFHDADHGGASSSLLARAPRRGAPPPPPAAPPAFQKSPGASSSETPPTQSSSQHPSQETSVQQQRCYNQRMEATGTLEPSANGFNNLHSDEFLASVGSTNAPANQTPLVPAPAGGASHHLASTAAGSVSASRDGKPSKGKSFERLSGAMRRSFERLRG